MNEESGFERRLQALLRDSADALDGHTRSQLTRARHAALAQQPRAGAASLRNWAPAGAVAAAVSVALLYVGQNGAPPVVNPAASSLDMLELLADSDAYELNAQSEQDLDYDFYEWAAAQEGAAGVGT